MPLITIGKGAITASRASIYENVPAGQFWGGFPAKPKKQWLREVEALERLAAQARKTSDEPQSGT